MKTDNDTATMVLNYAWPSAPNRYLQHDNINTCLPGYEINCFDSENSNAACPADSKRGLCTETSNMHVNRS